MSLPVHAEETHGGESGDACKPDENGKYISDVFIAYGKTEAEADLWLRDHGWEPVKGSNNFDAGKAHSKSICAAMGIKRTDNYREAITDMAVMNMSGNYSIPNYDEVVEEKRDEINEFIYSFMPVIEEYRENYNDENYAAHDRG